MDSLSAWEPVIRLAAFGGSILVLGLLERFLSCRPIRPWREYLTNAALLLTNTVLIRLISVTSLVGLAYYCSDADIGLINQAEPAVWFGFLAAFVALDFATYLQHRLFHWVPFLWRLHRVHHCDTNFDLSTGVRFHPGEILLSYALKAGVIALLGAPPSAVLCYEIALSTSALFTHANLKLPGRLDARLRWVIVTPNMHRIHHSVDIVEHNHNFGFFLACWDRVLGSYLQNPSSRHETMAIGLAAYPRAASFAALLANPLRAEAAAADGG